MPRLNRGTAKEGAIVKLQLKLPRKALKTARKALRRHKRVNAKVTVTGRDAAGNVATQKRTIRLTN